MLGVFQLLFVCLQIVDVLSYFPMNKQNSYRFFALNFKPFGDQEDYQHELFATKRIVLISRNTAQKILLRFSFIVAFVTFVHVF